MLGKNKNFKSFKMKYSEEHFYGRTMKVVEKFRELHKEFVVCTNLLELLRQ
jgi:hypothetical protein